MIQMAKKIFILVFTSLVILKINTVYASNEIQTLLSNDINKYNIPGIVVSISYPNKTTYTNEAGYSVIKNKVSMDKYQLFPIGSITKSFVAVLALQLQLQEQGKLRLSNILADLSRKQAFSSSFAISCS